jgi:glycosyltransferase involved in cell wall biosynthesis
LNQTYSEVEHIFINDGSTDGSAEILNHYAQRAKIKVIHKQKNEGIAAAYRDAQKLATGEILCFLDADDIARPDRLAKTVQKFKQNPGIQFVYSAMELIDRDGISFGLQAELPDYVNNKDLFIQLFRRNFFTGSALSVRNDPRLTFNLDVICCDYALCLQMAEMNMSFSYIPEALTLYRIHGKNASSGDRMFRDFVAVQQQYNQTELIQKWTKRGYPLQQIFTTLGIMAFSYEKNDEAAFQYFKQAEKAGVVTAEVYFYLGCLYYKQGMWMESYESFSKAYSAAPDRFQIVNNLGVLSFLIGGNFQQSENLITKAMEIQPYYLMIKENLKALYQRDSKRLRLIYTLTDNDAVYISYCKLQAIS